MPMRSNVNRYSEELLNQVEEFLASYRYVQDKEDDNEIPFEATTLPQVSFIFPKETPAPQYQASRHRSDEEWTNFAALQLDTRNLSDEKQLIITAQTPKLSVDQKVGIQMLIQPMVLRDQAHFTTKLRVERLMVGVPQNEFLNFDEHQSLGYFPYEIRIDIEPQVDSITNLCAIPTLDPPKLIVEPSPSDIVQTSTTNNAGAQLGYGPAKINFSRSWAKKRDETILKMDLVRIDEVEGGNAASFEWKILRWKSNKIYDTKKQHEGVRWWRKQPELMLPFRGSTVSLEAGIPDIIWKLPQDVSTGALSFRIRLQVAMDLMWWHESAFTKSIGSAPAAFPYEHVWRLQRSSYTGFYNA